MIFGKWLITTNHMTCKSNRTVNPHQMLTSVIRVTPVDVLPIKKRLRCVYTTPLLEISMTQQELLTRMNPNNSFKEAELSRCWATFELSCRIRRPAYKMDPCFTGFEFSSVYFSPSGESRESHTICNPEFEASRGWIEKCFNHHKLSLRTHTSVNQKLPSQQESVLTKFYADTAKFLRIGKYPLSLVGNMDETPAFFDMVPSKCIAAKGTKECVVLNSGGEKIILQLFCQLRGMGKCSHQ